MPKKNTNPGFRTRDFVFRPTAMSEALQNAGMAVPLFLVREDRMEGTLRDRNDTLNIRPSRHKQFKLRSTAA